MDEMEVLLLLLCYTALELLFGIPLDNYGCRRGWMDLCHTLCQLDRGSRRRRRLQGEL